jgi:ribosomal protein L7/L12
MRHTAAFLNDFIDQGERMTERYEVVVEQFPENYVPVIQAFRFWKGLGLKEAKELYQYAKDNCPCVLLAGVDLESAEDLMNQLRDVGVTVSMRESVLQNPMIVYPAADRQYELHWFFGLRHRSK